MIRTALTCSGAPKRWLARYSIAAMIFLSLLSPAGAVDLFDDFERADSGSLGNGWIEKTDNAFTIQGGEAAKQSVPTGYIDNIVYRPASEDLLDQEASIELNWLSGSIGYPQLFVRIQSATVAQAGNLDGYMLYVSDSNTQAVLGRQTGGTFVNTLATLNLSSALNTIDRFRLRLRATGATPVQLLAWVERFDGSAWQIIGQATVNDAAANRISAPGAVGFGGYVENSYSYDNFQRLDLDGGGGTPTNPVPVSTTVTPDNANAGSGNLTITINGTDFLASSIVRWNGSNRVTTLVSATQLNADITGTDLATAGSATVTVFNPAPGGGSSAPLTFTINAPVGNPVPQTTTINPTNFLEGGTAFLLTVTGNSFLPTSVVRWNGVDRATAYVSDSQLQATIPDTDIAAAGTAQVSVFTPAPGGGLSNSQTFTIDPIAIDNPVPSVTGITPENVTEGSAGFNLTVTGTNFIPGTVVRLNGNDRVTTVNSSTQLTAVVTAADIATAGNADISVFNFAPGGGISNSVSLTIDPSGPVSSQTLNSVSPNSATVGDTSATLTVFGSGFTALSEVQIDGIILPTTFVNGTQLTATLDATLLADNMRGGMMVYTPEASNSLVGPIPFFVIDAGDALFIDDFNRPNGPDLGNQWTEKLPSAFALQSGMVTSTDTTPRAFNESITYRPLAEDAPNVEVAAEFIRTGTFEEYPQVHSRILRDTVGLASQLSSYTAFFFDSYEQYLTITPILDSTECYLAQFPLTRATVFGDRYRIRFRTLGTNPVVLTAYLDHFNVDRWETISAGSVNHDASTQATPGFFCNSGTMLPPVTTSGSTGLAKYYGVTNNYDSFYSIRLANDNNAAPAATSLTPSSAASGGVSFPLTVDGVDFIPGSVVRFNGSDRATTYVDTTQLIAQIESTDLLTVGSANITVFNPAPGGGESAPLSFMIGTGGVGLYDDFNRPDSNIIGNNWIEGVPSTFTIINGQVVKQPSATEYLDNLVYRPAAENLLNTEVSMEVQLTATDVNYPQLVARIQTDTVGPGFVDGYIFYSNNSDTEFIVGRQRGAAFLTPLATINLPAPGLAGYPDTAVYRMRLRVTGANPVNLVATLEIQNTLGGWDVLGQTTTTDSSAAQISTAGSVGFSGYINDGYRYDNFLRTNLAP